jgi:hypothetical protein
MKKNTLFYLLLQSVCVFLFFFIIELRPFDTVKNFFTKSIDNVKQNFKKSYQWLTQEKTPLKEEKKTPKYAPKIHPHNTNETTTIKNENNENQEKISTEKKTEITESKDITEKSEEEKIATKKKSKNKRLEKLFNKLDLEQVNNPEFRETFIDKYNNYITEKAAKKGKTVEPSLLLTSEKLDTSLQHYKKKKDLKENWKKKYQKKFNQKKGLLQTSPSKNSDWQTTQKTNTEKSEEYIANSVPPLAPPPSEDEKKDPEIEKKVENLLIPSLKLSSLYSPISAIQQEKKILSSALTEVIKNSEAEKNTLLETQNQTTLNQSIINTNKDTPSEKDNNESKNLKKSNKIEQIFL